MRKRRSISEEKLKKIAKYVRIAGYMGSLVFFGASLYWFSLPGGWIIGIGFLISAVFIAVETYRVFK